MNKKENWNDQAFTDLEAEVEVDGAYYANIVDKFLRRRSIGIRRLPSLQDAILSSVEQCLLLVGEPGSGKSVALRHLTIQLAEEAIRSRDPRRVIPLYVNLKELPSKPSSSLDANFMRTFVVENVRRGDADTSAYILAHWAEHRDQGRWFFLFDSFDEIPEVMHAPTGSPRIEEYASAVREFLTSMGTCRGILASREFKGPQTLPWQKLRILPLTESRQDDLVRNALLGSEQMRKVRTYLSVEGASLRKTPLLLSLLCRHVRQTDLMPSSNQHLLMQHVCGLAERDPEYLKGKYGFTPSALLDWAIRIAGAMAENAHLSLSPSFDELARVVATQDETQELIDTALVALVDTKIGRSDVQEARTGDRRFTFAHRRYQEALFVEQLIREPRRIPGEELLSDVRWREYAVTYLQTADYIGALQNAAAKLLRTFQHQQPGVVILPALGGHLRYYEWMDDKAAHLLTLLQEGLGQRLGEVSAELRREVVSILAERWNLGGSYDRAMVLRHAGLVDGPVLQDWLGEAIRSECNELHDAAFEMLGYLRDVPEALRQWFLDRLSIQRLDANSTAEILRLEALSQRLPVNIGATHVMERCAFIRRINIFLKPLLVFRKARSGNGSDRSFRRVRMSSSALIHRDSVLFTMIVVGMPGCAALFAPASTLTAYVFCRYCAGVALAVWAVTIVVLFSFRSLGAHVSVWDVWGRLRLSYMRRRFFRIASIVLSALLIACIPGALIDLVAWLMNWSIGSRPIVYLSSIPISLMLVSVAVELFDWRARSEARLRLAQLMSEGVSPALVLRANGPTELSVWLETKLDELLPSVASLRSAERLLLSVPAAHPVSDAPLVQAGWRPDGRLECRISDGLIHALRARRKASTPPSSR